MDRDSEIAGRNERPKPESRVESAISILALLPTIPKKPVDSSRKGGYGGLLTETNKQSRNLAWNQQYPFWALLPAIPKKPACPAYGKYRFDPWPAASEAKAPSGAETMTEG